jgi:hypothetical protein
MSDIQHNAFKYDYLGSDPKASAKTHSPPRNMIG